MLIAPAGFIQSVFKTQKCFHIWLAFAGLPFCESRAIYSRPFAKLIHRKARAFGSLLNPSYLIFNAHIYA